MLVEEIELLTELYEITGDAKKGFNKKMAVKIFEAFEDVMGTISQPIPPKSRDVYSDAD